MNLESPIISLDNNLMNENVYKANALLIFLPYQLQVPTMNVVIKNIYLSLICNYIYLSIYIPCRDKNKVLICSEVDNHRVQVMTNKKLQFLVKDHIASTLLVTSRAFLKI